MAHNEEGATTALAGTIISCDRQALRIACGSGILCVTELQLPGKKVLPIRDIINSKRELFAAGRRFDVFFCDDKSND